MQAPAVPDQPPAAQQPMPQQYAYPTPIPPGSTPPNKGHALRNVSLGCLGLIGLVILIGVIGSNGKNTTNNSTTSSTTSSPSESPIPSPSPVSEAQYKASAKAIPYVQLEKDPDALAGTVVVYTGQVVQYDSATTTSNLRINVTPDGFGGYTDTIWLDVDPAQTTKVFRDTVIKFWGTVVGAYTYTSVSGAQITIPEVDAKYIQVV